MAVWGIVLKPPNRRIVVISSLLSIAIEVSSPLIAVTPYGDPLKLSGRVLLRLGVVDVEGECGCHYVKYKRKTVRIFPGLNGASGNKIKIILAGALSDAAFKIKRNKKT